MNIYNSPYTNVRFLLILNHSITITRLTANINSLSLSLIIDIEGVEGMSQLIFSPPLEDTRRCVNVSFGNDDLVENDFEFAVTFTPANAYDEIEGPNMTRVTVVDEESKNYSHDNYCKSCYW